MKWRDWLLSLKIRQKIFYPSLLVAICLILLFSATFVYVTRILFEREARNNLATLANTMSMLVSIQSRALSAEEPSPEAEKKLMVSLLEPAKMKKQFVYLALFDRSAKLVAKVVTPVVGEETPDPEAENHERLQRILRRRITFVESQKNRMVFVAPVFLSGVFRGALIGSVSTAELSRELNLVIWLTLLVSLLILAAAVLVLRRLANSIAEPVVLLRDAADDLRERRFDSGLEKLHRRRWGKDELGFLKESFSDMGLNLKAVLARLEDKIALVNADLRAAHEELQKSHAILQQKQNLIERELAFAREVQSKLLPQLPQLPGFDMAARMQPAASVGGDFYALRRDREKNLTIIIGDVSGHGVPSALIMVLMREAFLRYAAAGTSLTEILERMNRVARAEFSPEMFTTCFLARFENGGRLLRYANAGHNFPLLVKKEKTFELDTKGFALGVSDRGNYEEKTIPLEPGDILVLYTDGLAELRPTSGEQFGSDRLRQLLEQ
ncbi:MAG: SpoIIE family protein phosphatase, partial [Leptospiraceae bacterium]|nr:SpoIIE family protein phosphatase [Leptospiraceae bacterium]